MSDEIELVSEGDGLAVIGHQKAVDRFLTAVGLREKAVALRIDRLSHALATGSDLAHAAAQLGEKTGRYVKLTTESAERLKAEGLMPSTMKGISHAMFGDPGNIGAWVQVEDTAGGLLRNTAFLAGVAGLMIQFAQHAEAHELKELLTRIDGTLDDVRRQQRDTVLARLDQAIETIDEALAIREHDGDTRAAWEKVVAQSGTIARTRHDGLQALEALADTVEGTTSIRALATTMREIETDAVLWLTLLARTFQLDNEYKILELDQVMIVTPDKLDYHRRALAENREKRQHAVFETTQHLINRTESASDVALSNVALHGRAARNIVHSVRNIGESVDDFNRPLTIEVTRKNQPPT